MAVKANDGGDEGLSEINITPFTDVLLVLLIIFMIAATAVAQNGFNINLPKAATTATVDNTQNIILSITKSNEVFVNSEKMKEDEILPLLKRMKKAKNTDRVIILAEGTVKYSRVITLMDLAKQAELNQIALAIQKDEGK